MSRSANAAASIERSRVRRGDAARPPGRDPALLHQRPQPREPVGQLEGVGDQLPGGVQGDPERRTEVAGRELRHQRRTLAGQRDEGLAVQVDLAPVRRPLVGGAGVQVRPLERRRQLLGRGDASRGLAAPPERARSPRPRVRPGVRSRVVVMEEL